MPLHRRLQRKNLHRPLTSCRSAQNARQRRKEQRNTGGGNLSLTGEQKNFQRLAHGSGKKLAMEKEADQMRRIAHDTGKKKRPAPVSHGRSEGDFPSFCVMPPAGGAPKSGRLFRQTHSAPGETPPRQEIDRPHLPAGKFTPQESPQDKPGEGKFPSGGCARPSLCSKSLRPGLRPHDRKPTPPAGSQMEALRPGPGTLKADTALSTKKHVPPGSECCACALLPRENAFSDSPQGRLRHFLPA